MENKMADIDESKIAEDLASIAPATANESPSNDQAQGVPATIEIDGEKLTLDELKSGYMKNKDYTVKTQELARARDENASIRQELNAAMAMMSAPQKKALTEDDVKIMMSAIMSAKAEDPDEPVSKGALKKIVAESTRSVETSAAEELKQLKEQMNAELGDIRGKMIQREIQSEVKSLIRDKYPDADENVVYALAYVSASTTNQLPNIEAIVKKDHESRTPSKSYMQRLHDNDVFEEAQRRINAKKEKMKPAEGGKAPDIFDEQLEAAKKARDWDTYGKILNKRVLGT